MPSMGRQFYSWDRGDNGELLARTSFTVLNGATTQTKNTINSVLLACIITARTRDTSPSILIEHVNRSTDPTEVATQIVSGWNMVVDQVDTLSEQIENMGAEMFDALEDKAGKNPPHFYEALITSNEEVFFFWAVVTDFMVSYRTLLVLKYGLDIPLVSDMLYTGMFRSKLMRQWEKK